MKIAVTIPTMNRPSMLREAIRSALDQTRPPDEIFISDNSKVPDETLLRDFPNAPIHYHFHNRRLPIEEHWTWALSQPQSDYVCWLEDDNLFRKNHFAVMEVAAQQYPNAGLYGTAAIVFRDQKSPMQREVFAPMWKVDLLTLTPLVVPSDIALATHLFGTPIASSCVMINKKLWDAEPLVASGCRQPLDRWLWAQMASRGSVVFSPLLTMLYRVHGQQHGDSDDFAKHRSEKKIVSDLILKRMAELSIDPEKAVTELLDWIEPSMRERLAYYIITHRDWELAKRFIPILMDTKPGQVPLTRCLKLIVKHKLLS